MREVEDGFSQWERVKNQEEAREREREGEREWASHGFTLDVPESKQNTVRFQRTLERRE